MEKQKQPAKGINVRKVNKALREWSPKGLCSGTLVLRNGVKEKTEGCAVGCLALGYLYTKEGTRWAKDEYPTKENPAKAFTDCYLKDEPRIDGTFQYNVAKHYGIPLSLFSTIIDYNDTCLTPDNSESSGEDWDYIPEPIRKTIKTLRERNKALKRKAKKKSD